MARLFPGSAAEYGQNSVLPNPHGLLSITSEITLSQRRWKQMNLACGKTFRKVPAALVALVAASHHRGWPESAMRAPETALWATAIEVTRARIEEAASAENSWRLSMRCQVDAIDSHIGSRPVLAVQKSEDELARKS